LIVPIHKRLVLGREVGTVWTNFTLSTIWMKRITCLEEAPSTPRGLHQDTIAARVRRFIGNAVFRGMHWQSGPVAVDELCRGRLFDDFVHREI